MTKLIGIFITVLVIYGCYKLYTVWENYDNDRDLQQREAAANHIDGNQLAGMPDGLQPTYEMAQKNGAVGVRKWLKAYGARVQDPRRAWIELDYVVLVSHDDPVEAKKVFEDVKSRTPENSPVYTRIKQLEKTYE